MEENQIQAARALAEAYWGKDGPKGTSAKGVDSYVKEFKPIDSSDVTPILGKYHAFIAAVYNPASQVAGRAFRLNAMVVNSEDESVQYFEKDIDVAAFLTKLNYKLDNQSDVLSMMNLFEAMNGFQLADEENKELESFVQIENYGTEMEAIDYSKNRWPAEDWQYVIQKENDGWAVQVIFLDDPVIEAYRNYKLKLSMDGKITIVGYKIAFRYGYR